jgi:hypothetical protein
MNIFDPDRQWWKFTAYGHQYHFLFGVVMAVSVHLPLLRSFFAPWVVGTWYGPVLWASLAGFAYEVYDALLVVVRPELRGRPDSGFGIVDWAYVTAGGLVIGLGKLIGLFDF